MSSALFILLFSDLMCARRVGARARKERKKPYKSRLVGFPLYRRGLRSGNVDRVYGIVSARRCRNGMFRLQGCS